MYYDIVCIVDDLSKGNNIRNGNIDIFFVQSFRIFASKCYFGDGKFQADFGTFQSD